MERLTERNPLWIDDELWERACEPDCEEIDAVYRKLKDYEDAEEQGLLLRLPCRVGDTVYVNNGFAIFEYEVTLTGYSSTSKESSFYLVTKSKKNSDTVQEFSDGDFGKTVFLTRDEAEAKLKEMEGNYGGE